MSDPARRVMTVDEFLVWDDGTDTRYELIGGEPVAMAPPSPNHGALTVAIAVQIAARLRPPCRVISEAGIRLANRNDSYFQADLAVTCQPLGPALTATPDPTVIVEVLSPSTEGTDRTVKLPAYRNIDSVQEILLISATKRRAELWHRSGDEWRVRDIIGDGVLRFESLDAEIPMTALYDGLV
ncbi:Uma2 family endonuclease [Azospirillum agricola]|uniref:Uma2 family endonuclease n=1 Tax=Azospirillum agricola TaxID=1720247 RepID=UPI000A0EF84B|nr:Uma2 family endonuclease [Azospirillum agricola]SMH54936.1 Endonuclease, Uma2 family (restriction endonuclease fold) [Azospirillum lipoferum]